MHRSSTGHLTLKTAIYGRKETFDTGMLLSPPKTRNREPLKPVDDFDRCAIRNKIHEFYTVYVVSYQLLRNCMRAKR